MKKQTLNKLLFIFILVILVNIAPKVAKADTYIFGVESVNSMAYYRNLSSSLGHTGSISSPFVPGEVLSFTSGLQCPSGGGYSTGYPSCILSASINLSINRAVDGFVFRDFGNLYNQSVYPSGSLYDNRTVTYTIPSNFTNKNTSSESYKDIPTVTVTMIQGPSGSTTVQPSFNTWIIAAPVVGSTGTVTLTVYQMPANILLTQTNKITSPSIPAGSSIRVHWQAIGFNSNISCHFPDGTSSPVGTAETDYYPPANPALTTNYSINCSDSTYQGGTTVTTDSVTPHGPWVLACATVTSVASLSSRGLVYGLNSNPTIADSITTTGNGTGQTCSGASGNVGSSYYIRGFATTTSGVTIYGNAIGFGPLTATAY
jgi:hypothetical protein